MREYWESVNDYPFPSTDIERLKHVEDEMTFTFNSLNFTFYDRKEAWFTFDYVPAYMPEFDIKQMVSLELQMLGYSVMQPITDEDFKSYLYELHWAY
jgi:hypothetical protein